MEYVVIGIVWLLCGILSLQIANTRHAVNPMYWWVVAAVLVSLAFQFLQ